MEFRNRWVFYKTHKEFVRIDILPCIRQEKKACQPFRVSTSNVENPRACVTLSDQIQGDGFLWWMLLAGC